MPSPNLLLALGALVPVLSPPVPSGQPKPAPTTSAEQRNAQRAMGMAPLIQKHWTYLNRLCQTDEFITIIARTS
ncbi:hypothetical protein BH18VER2_BH18VER2_11710 [soil metagenome]